MKAAVLVKPSTFQIQAVEFPAATSDWPEVRVSTCGICGSDLAIYHRDPPIPKYWPGHEIAGYLDDRLVVINPLISCGVCDLCKSNRENICQNALMISHHLPGGFAEFVRVPFNNIMPIESNVQAAVFTEPIASSLHMINTAPSLNNMNVMIIGGGTIGLILLQLAYWKKAKQVKLITRHLIQEKLVKKWGAVKNDIKPDVVFVAAAGDGFALEQAVNDVKPGGRVVLAANIYNSRAMNLKWLVEHEVTVLGSQRYKNSEFEVAITLIEKKIVDVDPLVTHRFGLDDISTAYSVALNKSEHQSVKVLIDCQ